MAFHQRLKHERLAKGWTIEQLSQASGVTVNRIAMLERNLVEMVSDNLMACLAKALEVDFDGPPSPLSGAEPVAVSAPAQPAVTPAAVICAEPEPFTLHLSVKLQQQLEAAGHAHGRSLHGEILARLEASLLGERQPAAPSAGLAPTSQAAGSSVLQLSEADLAHITEQVAARLQARR